MNKLHLRYKADTGKNALGNEFYLHFKRNSKGEIVLQEKSSNIAFHWSSDESEIHIEEHDEEYVKYLEEIILNL